MLRFVATLLLISASVAVAGEPLGFKGFYLGTPKDELALDAFSCSLDATLSGSCSFDGYESIGGAQIQRWSLEFVNGRLGAIIIVLRRVDLDDVRASLTEKYGKPIEAHATGQDLKGHPFDMTSFTWKHPEGTVVIADRTLDEGMSSVTYFNAAYAAAQAEKPR